MKRACVVLALTGLVALAGLVAMAASLPAADEDKPVGGLPDGYKLLYAQDFKTADSLKDFVFSDPAMWQWTDYKGRGVLDYAGITPQSNRRMACAYKTKVRSPFIIGLVAAKQFGDFVLEADMFQNGQDYGHRDMCIYFGYTDAAKFYYTHIAKAADPNAHNIMIVNDEPRKPIATKTTKGVDWTDGWHKVRLERKTADGSIKVFFDDMTTPIMEATDKTFGWGWAGFGSFDDSGFIGRVRIWGPEAKEAACGVFSAKERTPPHAE